MSIPINSLCLECHFRKRLSLARELGNEDQAMEYAHKVMQALLDAPKEMDSTWLGSISDKLMQDIYGLDPDRLKAEKEFSNRFVLERLDSIQEKINKADDPVYAALQFAVLGKYLDFSALQGEVSFAQLEQMLSGAAELDLDKDCYRQFRQDLSGEKKLL